MNSVEAMTNNAELLGRRREPESAARKKKGVAGIR